MVTEVPGTAPAKGGLAPGGAQPRFDAICTGADSPGMAADCRKKLSLGEILVNLAEDKFGFGGDSVLLDLDRKMPKEMAQQHYLALGISTRASILINDKELV
jgi:hypothetical protein